MSIADIPQWKALSSEYDGYVKEQVPDLTEWYEGNDDSPAFEAYMEAKIGNGEAFMAVDATDGCLGAIAFSKRNNRITFFGIAHAADFRATGDALLRHALDCLDTTRPIVINEIASDALWVQQHEKLYLCCDFIHFARSHENGVPVNVFERRPTL